MTDAPFVPSCCSASPASARRGAPVDPGGLPDRAAQCPGEGLAPRHVGHRSRPTPLTLTSPLPRASAKPIEYPVDDLGLAGTVGPWGPTALFVLTVAVALSSGLFPRVVGGSRQ